MLRPKKTLRYPTLEALTDAYNSGELPEEYELVIDNDSTAVYIADDEVGIKVFEGGCPSSLLEKALDMLGIPWCGA